MLGLDRNIRVFPMVANQTIRAFVDWNTSITVILPLHLEEYRLYNSNTACLLQSSPQSPAEFQVWVGLQFQHKPEIPLEIEVMIEEDKQYWRSEEHTSE